MTNFELHVLKMLESIGFSSDSAFSIVTQYKQDDRMDALYDYAKTKLSLASSIDSIPLRDT